MDNTLCDFCEETIYNKGWELAVFFDRECQAIKDSARLGCRLCAILEADLDLVDNHGQGPESKASIYFTSIETFLDPENDPWGLMLGLNNTPLRYLLRLPAGKTTPETRGTVLY